MALPRARVYRQQPEVSDIRVLSRADLSVLAIPRPSRSLQSLRDSHHRVARAVAAGLSGAVIAETCGISQNRVSVLRQDPAFIELVAHYRAVVTAEYINSIDPVIEFMRTNAIKAQAQIAQKLEEAEEKGETLPTRELLGISELGFDRIGYGKERKNVNVNVDFAAQLESARKRASGVESARVVGGTSLASQSAPAVSQPLTAQQPGPPNRHIPSPPIARRF